MAAAESTMVTAATAAGITLFGVATGVDPSLLVGGIAGGWWATFQFDVAATVVARLAFITLSALLGALLTPLFAVVALDLAGKAGMSLPEVPLRLALAVVIGLLAIRWLGPRIVAVAGRAADRAEGGL